MKIHVIQITASALLFIASIGETLAEPVMKLWYDEPASEWVEAFPVGNGRLGAMIYSGTETERGHTLETRESYTFDGNLRMVK